MSPLSDSFLGMIVAFGVVSVAAAQSSPQTLPNRVIPQSVREGLAVVLWRDLTLGQTVVDASARISKYAEVKKIAVKNGKKGRAPDLRVAMNKGGIAVYGSEFSLDLTFDASGKLTGVLLVGESECANQSVKKFEKMSGALEEKYGPEATGRKPLTGLMAASALLRSYQSERNETVTYGYANSDVAVVFVLAFHNAKPPPYAGSGKFASAMYSIAKSLYESQKAKCLNSGDETVTYAIKYLARSEFDAQIAATAAEREKDDKQADENL